MEKDYGKIVNIAAPKYYMNILLQFLQKKLNDIFSTNIIKCSTEKPYNQYKLTGISFVL